MTFPTLQLDPERVETQRRLFGDGIEEDEWAMFHGTSGCNAESIESNGFDPVRAKVSLGEILRVMAVFKKMRWMGEDLGGYGVLKAYSFGHDFTGSGKSMLFFAETSMRGLLYATRDFSGGEKSRALRRAFNDLEFYLHDPDPRQRHWSLLKAEYNYLSENNASPASIDAVRPAEVDLGWLEQEIDALSEIRRAAEHVHRSHDHGVVYALRMTPDDIRTLKYNNAMGIETDDPIPVSRIVGKVIVPRDYETHQPGRSCDDADRTHCGLLGALRSKIQ